ALAYHGVTALAYCLGPVALFALALRLSKSRWAAFAAGAMYSCLTFSAWLIPVIRTDLGSAFHPRRLQATAAYGEGPHVSSMTLVPPSTISAMVNNARTTGGNYTHAYQAALPQGLAILTALILIKLVVRRLNAPLQFAIFVSLLMALIALTDAYWNVPIVPMG